MHTFLADPKCHRPLDVILAIDSSGRTSAANWETILQFCKSLVVQLEPISARENRVGVLTFNEQPDVVTDLNRGISRSQIEKSFNKLRATKPVGMTFTDNALKEALRLYESGRGIRDAHKVLILFYDGKTADRLGKRGVALMKEPTDKLHKQDVNTFVVEFGPYIGEEDILNFVSAPKLEHIYTLNDLPELAAAVKKEAWRACAQK